MSGNDYDHLPDHQNAAVVAVGKDSQVLSDATADSLKAIPIPPIPHISENFLPLSLVVSRLVENTYSELVNLLDTLSAANDITKKRKFLSFLIHTRQQYIKIFVLTQWSRNAGDISKVIDVVSWLGGQRNCFSNVVWALQAVKQDLGGARLRNPDLATALEVLVLGEPRLSTFNLVPPKPLSPKRILDTLHHLNVLLSLRLSLKQDIPPQFKQYKISNGRVTFSTSEFEVDLGIADDAPDAQFFLIDFRFKFEPESKVTPAIRMNLERVGNEKLKSNGLTSLYEYLHMFTLSYKLLVLNQQLLRLANGVWTGTLTINHFAERQIISLQYWSELPGKKSLAEFGVLQSKVLGVHWIPRDFPSHTYSIDQTDISAQTIVSQIVTLHVQQILSAIVTAFKSSSLHASLPSLITTVSDTMLKIKLTPTDTTTLTIEHLTGRMILEGESDLIEAAEKELNSHMDVNLAPQTLCKLRHLSLQREIEGRAEGAGWEIVRVSNIRPEDVRNNFGVGLRNIYMSTMRHADWMPGWFLVVTISDSQTSLWLIQLKLSDGGWSIVFNQAVEHSGIDILYAPEKLSRLAVLASARISFNIIAASLSERNIKYEFVQPDREHGTDQNVFELPTLHFDLSNVTKPSWAKSAVTLEFLPLPPPKQSTILARGLLEPSVVLSSVSATSTDVVLDVQNNRFSMYFYLPPADQVIPQMIERLTRIERVVTLIRTLQLFSFEVEEISLGRISFSYRGEKMAIWIGSDGGMHLKLDSTNPFSRIQFFLQDVLDRDGLKPLVALLPATLPILRVANGVDNGDVYFLVRSAKQYRLVYNSKRVAIDIQLRDKNSEKVVYITDSGASVPGFTPCEACGKVWNMQRPDARCLDSGIVCEATAAEEVLWKLHDVITSS
ncbi:mediator complex subunit MED14-domain-containing protein [Limtongia smithiae]|uniref:mediator complex subunit MED14-domain-containing protein n=1 Tax=Limtongia smithiae TaxID=1125753 RepID=UPI0034CE208B